ncbi:MAG: 16S rRNA (adenine(1518)-N(6)/adenine(1519)-N(6))-dimethyltransferase RsmA [Gammaproteobacteria bacterium]|nr:16S rRNA (adenine(1518)-N(6)/adenine(1519)-N(6))-dimethyltransferase RsmA [Gammaproteobacteria bacterium]
MTGARRRKRLGQHFLRDPRVIDRIVAAIAPNPEAPLVEIGPGHGALTVPLLKRTQTLHVIEVDPALAAQLTTRCEGFGDLRLHVADALQFDFCSLGARRLKVAGNLPYRISTPLLFHLLAQAHCLSEMIFMLQLEVVDRICATPGTREYGRLSVMVQARSEVRKLFDVGRGAFSPPPQVESAVVRLVPTDTHVKALADEKLFDRVVKLAFGQRRKKLRNALKELVPQPDTLLTDCGIDPGVRAEELTVEQFGKIANRLAATRSVTNHPPPATSH